MDSGHIGFKLETFRIFTKSELEKRMIPWHRLFGLTLTDFFQGTAFTVELEKDLSLKQQFLDVVIIKRQEGNPPPTMPDGLENPADHNLITYKSHSDTLASWEIDELCGHYVNYRKQISPSLDDLLPEDDFNLYAVSTRFPENLAKKIKSVQKIEIQEFRPGIFDLLWGVRVIRLIVLSQIPKTENNAPWLMFSADPEKVGYGAACYKWRSPVSTVMNNLLLKYKLEGIAMPYTIDDYMRDIKQEAFKHITGEDIDRILSTLKPEDRLRGLKPEDRLRGLKPEDVLPQFKLEDRFKGLNLKEIEEYLNKMKSKETIH